MVGIGEQLAEVERAAVVEPLPGDALQDRVDVSQDWIDGSCAFTSDGCLGRLQHAVEPPQYGEREDDTAVLGCFVVAAQEIGDRPDEGDLVLEVFHEPSIVLKVVMRQCRRHRSGCARNSRYLRPG